MLNKEASGYGTDAFAPVSTFQLLTGLISQMGVWTTVSRVMSVYSEGELKDLFLFNYSWSQVL